MNKKTTDKNQLWFKGKTFGYGWTPTTWQGWLTIVVGVLPALIGALLMDSSETTSAQALLLYFIAVAIGVAFMIMVSYKKGPKPKWNWGRKLK